MRGDGRRRRNVVNELEVTWTKEKAEIISQTANEVGLKPEAFVRMAVDNLIGEATFKPAAERLHPSVEMDR